MHTIGVHHTDCYITETPPLQPFARSLQVVFTGVATGTARLTGGRADPGGAWAYGRLEVFDRFGYISIISSSSLFGTASGLGRNAAAVACRSLGFEAGAEITAGSTSALPGPTGDIQPITSITCVGDEATLGDCDISSGYFRDYGDTDGNTVAVLCSTPSGACPPMTALRLARHSSYTTKVARLSRHD